MRSLFSDRFFLGGMALFAVIVALLQVQGGAYSAEFTGHPDEPAHFISSLAVYDYLHNWPPPDPIPWASVYYLHYPKVALGHWPPGYYLAQALWWLLFPVGRASALWLNAVMVMGSMALFSVLASRIRPGWPALLAGILMLGTPVLQESQSMVLADLPSLTAGLAVLWALTRLIEDPGVRRLWGVAGAIAATLVIKGTGAALLAAPLVAVAGSGIAKRLRARWVAGIAVAIGFPALALYMGQYRGSLQTLVNWAGMSFGIPWRIDLLPGLAGAGCLVLAVVGMVATLRYRQPAAVAAAAVLLSMAGVSFAVRAMREPRHWIVAVPALLLLNLAAYAWLEKRRPLLAMFAAAIVLFSFPFSFYRQQPEGFAKLASQLRLPPRQLVSSTVGWSEGSWIATVAMNERRPTSTIVRATKLLASSDWNGKHYQQLVRTHEDVERKLDETAIDLVVLHNAPPHVPDRMPHHPLLREFLKTSKAWRLCGQVQSLEAYCRILPPRYPRRPLRIDLRSRLGQEIEEH